MLGAIRMRSGLWTLKAPRRNVIVMDAKWVDDHVSG